MTMKGKVNVELEEVGETVVVVDTVSMTTSCAD